MSESGVIIDVKIPHGKFDHEFEVRVKDVIIELEKPRYYEQAQYL